MNNAAFDVSQLGWLDRIFAALILGLCVMASLSSSGGSTVVDGDTVLLSAFLSLAVCGFPLLLWKVRRISPVAFLGMEKTGPGIVYWKGGLGWVVVVVIGGLVSLLLQVLGQGEGSAPVGLEGNALSAFVGLVILIPVAEEILFRGVLYGGLKSWVGSKPVAATIAAAAFAISHGDAGAWPHLFFLGLLLCWALDRSGSIWASVSIHALNNAVAFVALINR